MRFLRLVLAIAVLAVAAAAIVRQPLQRHLCNRAKWSAEEWVERAGEISSDFERQDRALRKLERLDGCGAALGDDWQVPFLRGALQETAGQQAAALASYRTALALEKRPEIYHAISVLQFSNGQPEEALANAERAATFSLYYADQFDPELRHRLFEAVQERNRRLTAER